ncbi:MAG TPA: hypothetical protein VKV26_22795 [Dehalococcoidia bacterium]|nr:hypothetical protein [Dehalococcoidia bacterium]
MPASRIERALAARVPEPIVAWHNGQSLESRYGRAAPAGGVTRVAAGAILRHQFNKARRPDAVTMPRFPVVAVSAGRVYWFAGPVPAGEPVAVLERAECGVIVSGNWWWRRLDLVAAGEPARSYTVLFNGLFGSRKRLANLLRALAGQGSMPPA